jgi:trk system potassium uptake protein
MKRTSSISTVFNTLGSLLMIMGLLLLLPVFMILYYREYSFVSPFLISAAGSFLCGFLFTKIFKRGTVYFLQSILVCGIAWFVLCVFACLPFYLSGFLSFLDSYFETVSGFTTTGITVITEIEVLPRCILFWRSFIQWVGGLGILTLFLAVTYKSNNAYFQLFSAESHKIESARPTPSITKTVIILWGVYAAFTLIEGVILRFLGLSGFDALCHSLTTLSTGGFSTYDASILHFGQAGYRHYKAIEYVITIFMFFGGVSFLLHFKLFSGGYREVFRNTEFKWYCLITGVAVLLILTNRWVQMGGIARSELSGDFRSTIFTVVSIITTTGFGTVDINDPFFPFFAKQIFLILMLIGGSVGSTSGGIKVLRIVVFAKLFRNQIRRLRLPRKAVSEVIVDRSIFPEFEIKRISGLFIGWLFLIMIGGFITALFTELDSWQAFSGMFSAVGNIGPCYFSVAEMAALPAIVKLTYIFGMLAGRLEILPVLLVFSWRAWKY